MTGFFAYLRTKWRIIVSVIAAAVFFLITFFLYKLPMAAAIYPIILCLVLAVIGAVIDYMRIKKKRDILRRLKASVTDTIVKLPEADTLVEDEYRQMVEAVQRELMNTRTRSEKDYRDMVDYYTTWAHQIKTPIASMKLALGNEDSELARRLQSELFRMQQYVDMVLAFVRLGAPSTDYVFKEYSLDDMIKSSVKKFANEFILRRLSFDFAETGKSIITDEKWLTFVLQQLLSNALKYTMKGGVRIYADGDVLCIEDTGIGIAPEDLPRITEKGYTGFNGRKDKNASGIGLYLGKQICDRLGIGLQVISVQGEGTCVRLDISQKRRQHE